MPVSHKEYKKAKMKYWLSSTAIFLLCTLVPMTTMYILRYKFDAYAAFAIGLFFLFIVITFFKGSFFFNMFEESCEIMNKYKKGY